MNASVTSSIPYHPNHHILIIEDDPAIATTLRYALERENWQVTWIDNATQVLDTLTQLSDLSAIVMDVGLPDGNGFVLCQQVRFGSSHAHVPILFLTARNDEVDKILGLEMGADDYITKPFSPREVIARLKAIWRRQDLTTQLASPRQIVQPVAVNTTQPIHCAPLLSQEPLSSAYLYQPLTKQLVTGHWHYEPANYQLTWNGQPLILSKTELAIMLTLLHQPQHILSREQILNKISDYPEHRLARTIDSHIKTLRQKLAQIYPDHEVIVTHRGLGYGLRG